MKWIQVVVKTFTESEDYVSAILYEAGADGLEIEDPQDIINLVENPRNDWTIVEASLIKGNVEDIYIRAYFPKSKKFDNIKEFIINNIDKSHGEISFNEINDNDWSESWKKYYKPLRIGKNIVIKPSWEDFDIESDDIMIELDPGMAFGTGTHETTIMCTEALESFVSRDNKVYDIGCGSGILSIVGAKLGASNVVGVDLDPNSIKVSKENIKINNVEDKVEIVEGNLLDVIKDKADIIVSNILAEVIAGMTGDVRKYLVDDGVFITSGIILDKIDLVKDSLIENKFTILETRTLGKWACIIARK